MPQDSSLTASFFSLILSVVGALIFNIGGVFAGRTAVLLNKISAYLPWVFLVYPLLLTVRGDINGILSSRLSSALHLGTIEPSWLNNTKSFYQLIILIFTISLYDAIIVSLISFLACITLSIDVSYSAILSITVTTFVLGSIISIFLTFSFTFFVFNVGGDPDVYVYPIMSTINDVIITLTYFLVCTFYQPWKTKRDKYLGIPFVILTIIIVVVILGLKLKKKETSLFSDLKQVIVPLSITTIIAAFTGTILTSFEKILNTVPIFIVIYPALLSTVGAQSSILANSTTTKLHLGTLKPTLKFFKEKTFVFNFSGIMIAGIIMALIYSVISTALLPENVSVLFYGKLMITLIVANLLAFTILGNLSIFIAILFFRKGLDPDNLVVPLLTTFADLVTTIILASLFYLIFI